MPSNIFKTSIAILASLSVFFLSVVPTFASEPSEIFWYKDTKYNSYLYNSSTNFNDITHSTIVVAASTLYNGSSNGKEKVRAWTRDTIVKNYYNATSAQASGIEVQFTSQKGDVTNFINSMVPVESSQFTSAGHMDWWMKGIRALGYHWSIALSNVLNASVKHSYTSNKQAGVITFQHSALNNVELPNNISYKDADDYYNGIYDSSSGEKIKNETSRGVVGYFNFQYHVKPGELGYVRAMARAYYRVNLGSVLYPVYTFPYTGIATVDHTISGTN